MESSAVARPRGVSMVLQLILFVWIAVWIVLAFTWPPLVPLLEETTRVVYFHIPTAWITVLALGWSMVHSVIYLRRRNIENDDQAVAAAELGLVFCFLATITGSLWAKKMWGSYWNWDPRETSIFFLLLIYGAYLALRSAIDGEEKRARLSAIYSVIAFVTVPFLVFVVPRLYFSLHPDPIVSESGKIHMDMKIRIVFFSMMFGFTGLYLWIQSMRVRVIRLKRRLAAPGGEA